jgi:hypothetical protein
VRGVIEIARRIGNGLDLQNQRLISLGAPQVGTDATNKDYVDTRYTPGSGLDLNGTAFEVKQGTGIVVDDGVAVDPEVVARKHVELVGNGVSTTITVTHNLGTEDVVVSVRDNSTKIVVYPDIAIVDANNVAVIFRDAPAEESFSAVVIG